MSTSVRLNSFVLLVIAAALAACDPAAPTAPDASTDAGPFCTTDDDCDAGRFCDGPPLCAPGAPGADARGCVVLSNGPCLEGQTCVESRSACVTDCAVVRDADEDGTDATECGGTDCDDTNPRRYPGATEICDAADVDEDCDGTTFGFRDADGDEVADAQCCNGSTCGTDCDDAAPGRSPRAPEVCDGVDTDCDGAVDEGVQQSFYPDADMDGAGDGSAAPVVACAATGGLVANDDDCDDTSGARNPGATEICDALDNDCDTAVDEMAVEVPWYVDADGDGYGTATLPSVLSCAAVPGYAVRAGDCDDADGVSHPFAPELCDRVDNDCGTGGGLDASEDPDDDGHAAITAACSGGLPKDDCDDAVATTYPGAPEACNVIDDDCSLGGGADASEDADADGHSAIGAACSGGLPTDDCDDTRPLVYPGALEICDGVDSNCSSGGGALPVEDADGDMHATSSAPCVVGGYPRDDCDDADSTTYGGAPELCDRLDNNCSSGGGVANGEDRDLDGFAAIGAACSGGFPRTDCRDDVAGANPLGTESCNSIDDDCDGTVDGLCLADVVPRTTGRSDTGTFWSTPSSAPTDRAECPVGTVVVGVSAIGACSGCWGQVARWTIRCAELSADRATLAVTIGVTQVRSISGGSTETTSMVSAVCPANTVLVGTQNTSSATELRCRPIVVSGTMGAYAVALGTEVGVEAGGSFTAAACPAGEVAVGIAAATPFAWYVESPRFICAALDVVLY